MALRPLAALWSRRTWILATAALVAVPATVIATAASSGSGHPTPSIPPIARAAAALRPTPTILPMAPWSIDGGAVLAAATKPAPHATPATSPAVPTTLAADGIPQTALVAYQLAARREATLRPSCHVPWPLLAAIGRVESDHGRFAGAVLLSDGTSTKPIIGPALNGDGVALIRDTDHGRLDGDPVYDHAVGPMQFIPSTWAGYGVDVDGHGQPDPFNLFDAAAAAADYLCTAGGDLATGASQQRAVLAYNHSTDYLNSVLGLEILYAHGAGVVVPAVPVTAPTTRPTLPPVNPGPPPAVTPPAHPKPPQPSPVPSPSHSRPPLPPGSSVPPSSPASSPSDPTTPPPSSPPTCLTPTTGSPTTTDSPATSDSPTPTGTPTPTC